MKNIEQLYNGSYWGSQYGTNMEVKDKHLIKTSTSCNPDGVTLEGYINELTHIASELQDARIDFETRDNYGDTYSAVYIYGWREMNDKELKLADQLRKKNQAKNAEIKQQKELQDRLEYERLKKKFEDD